MTHIDICNFTNGCGNCPFESECNPGFNTIVTKDELIEMLHEKTRKITSMLNNIYTS